MNSEMLKKLLLDSSPFIAALIYDMTQKKLTIDLFDDLSTLNHYRRIIFTEISDFNEDPLMTKKGTESVDTLKDIEWHDQGIIKISTSSQEIMVYTKQQPTAGFLKPI